MVYDAYEFMMTLRKGAPGFARLGQPRKLRDPYSFQQMKDKKFVQAKTKDEIVEEHAHVVSETYKRTVNALLSFTVGVFFLFQLLASGSEFYLLGAMAAFAYAMYKWWHSSACYSNYQQFEMRPILVPIEDIREPGITPYWLTGKKPTFTAVPQAH